MEKSLFLLVPILFFSGIACDRERDAKLISQEAEIKELKAKVAELTHKTVREHHYELRREGYRTWRFDPSTGETCIQLAPEADWQRGETKRQSCTCVDAFRHFEELPNTTEDQLRTADSYYRTWVEPACGMPSR